MTNSLVNPPKPVHDINHLLNQKHEPLPAGTRIAMLTAVILPFVGLLLAAVLLWGWGFRWVELGLFIGMYVLTAFGITVGFHRYFTHRSFDTHPIIQCILGILGSMAAQGPLLTWVAVHRRHHQHSDDNTDPHSPHFHGKGILGLLRGLFHAHLGWMFKAGEVNLSRYAKDLQRSALLRSISALFPLWIVIGLAIPTLLGFLLLGGWLGALLGLVWGGLVRIFFVHHVTWSVNSICHVWGKKRFSIGDESRNNFIFGVLAMGEGWHNNHHAHPTSARHGFRWWEIDFSYWLICAMAQVGLAWNVKLPARSILAT